MANHINMKFKILELEDSTSFQQWVGEEGRPCTKDQESKRFWTSYHANGSLNSLEQCHQNSEENLFPTDDYIPNLTACTVTQLKIFLDIQGL